MEKKETAKKRQKKEMRTPKTLDSKPKQDEKEEDLKIYESMLKGVQTE